MRAPPKDVRRLAEPNLAVLPAGTTLHRIHASDLTASSFNPCLGTPGRFSPLYSPDSACIGTIYASSTLEAAIFESIFHDVPLKSKNASVPLQNIKGRTYSTIKIERDLTVATLHAPDLSKLEIARRDLLESDAKDYVKTARWPEAIHARSPSTKALQWTSRRADPDLCYVFFGDRFQEGDWAATSSTAIPDDDDLIKEVISAARRAGITLTT